MGRPLCTATRGPALEQGSHPSRCQTVSRSSSEASRDQRNIICDDLSTAAYRTH